MTTAHRPTFDPARGKEAARGEAYHQRLLPAHKTLKFRQATQGAPDEQARRDLRAELLRSEAKHYAQKEGRALPEDDGDDEKYGQGDETASRKPVAAIEEGGVASENGGLKRKLSERNKAETGDDPGGMVDGEGEEDYEAKKRRVLEETRAIDAESESSESSEESDDDDDDDDEEEESDDEFEKLNKELAKIKAERAAAAAKQAEEKAKRDEEQREKGIALGNPLLNAEQGRGDYGVKRRWDDDVVFKNQARGTEERGKDKRFVNDLLRSDFHRRFMDKYIR